MENVTFECRNCGNREYRSVSTNRHSVIGTVRKIQDNVDCCDEPDYEDKEGVVRHRRQSSVARMY